MANIILGVDPDSKAHGVAVYGDGRLQILESMTFLEVQYFIKGHHSSDIEVHIEDVCANNAVFMAPSKNPNKIAEAKARGRTLGMCQQSQIELERLFFSKDIRVVKHKISKKWKSAKTGRPKFERITGWKGQSNEDTRSAAYFGYLGLKR